jgi:hypothetical protein
MPSNALILYQLPYPTTTTAHTPVRPSPKTSFVSHLILENIGLQEKDIKAIVSSLVESSNIRVLSLANNNLTGKSLTPIHLLQASTLKEVFLHKNRLGDEGMIVVKTFIRNNLAISSVDISDNGVGDLGISIFVGAILDADCEKKHTHWNTQRKFPVVRVAKNRFGFKGLMWCLKLSVVNTSVRYLDLSGNPNLDSILSVKVVTQFLKINRTLQTIDLRDTSIDANALTKLISKAKINSCNNLYLGNPKFQLSTICTQSIETANGAIYLTSGSVGAA